MAGLGATTVGQCRHTAVAAANFLRIGGSRINQLAATTRADLVPVGLTGLLHEPTCQALLLRNRNPRIIGQLREGQHQVWEILHLRAPEKRAVGRAVIRLCHDNRAIRAYSACRMDPGRHSSGAAGADAMLGPTDTTAPITVAKLITPRDFLITFGSISREGSHFLARVVSLENKKGP